jgi:8-oxo-dGTP pyrophosphatase MutT (NUDIX family)
MPDTHPTESEQGMPRALQRPVVCVLAVRACACEGYEVLLQSRAKPDDDTPYNGFLELPQGKVEANETLTEAAHRELREETGLTVTRFLVGGESGAASGVETSVLTTSHPLVCVTDAAQNHLGLCVVVEVSGEFQETAEASGHAWFTPSELVSLLSQSRIFPLNAPMVRAFLDSASSWNETHGPRGLPRIPPVSQPALRPAWTPVPRR